MENKEIILNLSIIEINLIIKGLGELQLKSSIDLYLRIQQIANEQLKQAENENS